MQEEETLSYILILYKALTITIFCSMLTGNKKVLFISESQSGLH